MVQWTLAYLMGAWVLLEATDFLAGEFGWGDRIVPSLTLLLGFGILSTITIAWFHGAAGWQRITLREAAIHGGIGALVLTAFWADLPVLATVGGTGGGPPPVTRVAVLYFKDHSADGELTPLSRDLTEAVVHRLAQVPALDVLPLTAVEPYRLRPMPYDSIVSALEVGSLVEGSMTRLDEDIVVTAQLIEAGPQVHQASWVFSQPHARPTGVVTDVADSIADAIRTTIGRQVKARRVETGTAVPEALALYRRADAILSNEASPAWRDDRRRGVALLDEADRLLEEAERLDPEWVEPTLLRIEVADLKSQLMGGAGTTDPSVLRSAIEHANRALVMTTDSAPLLERRGYLRFTLAENAEAEEAHRLYAAAEADLREASRLDEGRPHTWWGLSQVLQRQGNLEGAYEYARKAYATDSFMELTGDVLGSLTSVALDLGRLDEATRWCLTGRRLQPRDQTFVQYRLVILASLPRAAAADVETAWAYVDTLVATAMPDRRESWRGYGEMYVAPTLATAGQVDSAEAVIRRARRRLDQRAPASMQAAGAYAEAIARLRLGQYDAALGALRRYIAVYPGRAESLGHDWWFEELWDDPRFIELYGGTSTEATGGN